MIEDAVVTNVTQNVITLTVVILSIYPVVYICRSMIDFVAKAFSNINTDKIFKSIKFKSNKDVTE